MKFPPGAKIWYISSTCDQRCQIDTFRCVSNLRDSYLENEYLCNCPNQEEVLSGLGKLPLRYFVKEKTLQKLPNGQRLNGARTYQRLMRFFTTMDVSPAQLRTKAVGRLSELYRKV